MYANPLAERLWSRLGGYSYFALWNFWRSSTGNPLVTPLVLRVLRKKRKKELLRPGDGASWRRVYHTKAYARPSQRVAECLQQ